ncbi:MAG: ACP S-malonyltransferase [Bacillota bacterium]|jgi:[acyl-carrier-protein] S-malonyltransferase|nr:ACP S-malonyltransferase [Clostridia bacterium]
MGKLAFVFPGQGSQYVGMGKELAEAFPEAKAAFEEADRILGFSLTGLCWEGPEEDLKKTYNTQPAILTTSIACWRVLDKLGVVPDFVAGHSLGEYSALVAAGAMELKEAIRLVRFRGESMEQAVPFGEGTMAAVLGMSEEQIKELCTRAQEVGIVEPANFNCPGQVVIAGTTPAIKKAIELAKEMGAKRSIMLPVGGPFHSSLMEPARRAMAERLASANIVDGRIPVVANVNGRTVQGQSEIIDALVNQVTSPVLWEQSIRNLALAGVDTFIEVGPGKVLSGLIKKTVKDVKIINIEDPVSAEKAIAQLKECS